MKNTNQSAQEVDVEKLAEENADLRYAVYDEADEHKAFKNGFEVGYNQALQSKAIFSLEDARLIWNYAGNFFDEKGDRMTFDQFIQSLTSTPIQPKGREVEFGQSCYIFKKIGCHCISECEYQTIIDSTTNPSNKGA